MPRLATLGLSKCSDVQFELKSPATTGSDRVCQGIKTCVPGSLTAKAHTATTDRECAPCGDNTYQPQPNKNTCEEKGFCGVDWCVAQSHAQ